MEKYLKVEVEADSGLLYVQNNLDKGKLNLSKDTSIINETTLKKWFTPSILIKNYDGSDNILLEYFKVLLNYLESYLLQDFRQTTPSLDKVKSILDIARNDTIPNEDILIPFYKNYIKNQNDYTMADFFSKISSSVVKVIESGSNFCLIGRLKEDGTEPTLLPEDTLYKNFFLMVSYFNPTHRISFNDLAYYDIDVGITQVSSNMSYKNHYSTSIRPITNFNSVLNKKFGV